MGFVDVFKADETVTITANELYSLCRDSEKARLICNGVIQGVPNEYMKKMLLGAKYEDVAEEKPDSE